MTHTTPETGGQVLSFDAEVRHAQRELKAAAKAETLEGFDDMLDRIRTSRDGAGRGTFMRAEYQRLLDEGLVTRRRFFH